MFDAITKTLEDLSIRAKLTLGFTLVLLLTIVIAAVGWTGLSNLGKRSGKLSEIASINEVARDMRIARLSYTITPDVAHSAVVIKVMDDLDLIIDNLAHKFSDATDQRWIAQANSAVENYRAHFKDFVQGVEARDEEKSKQGPRPP